MAIIPEFVARLAHADFNLPRQPFHGFLLSGHGLYTWGKDLAEARRHIEIFEFLFEVSARAAMLAGAAPAPARQQQAQQQQQ